MSIGKLEKVELRDIWKNEAKDFTTWLYENLDALSEAINLNLLEPEQEKQVEGSRYSIDIMAETENGEGVIIENQLEQSDHKHLGQIITYLTNMDSKIAVWVCKEPRQEHINAINWLNETSDEDFNFYLVKLEAYKIGESEPAPFFSVICQPSKEQKEIGRDKKVLKEERLARKHRRDLCDTLVVPAQKEGFERVFLGENCWWAIRMRESRIEQIKWIAAYQVAPVSSITHIAKVKSIEPYKDTGKYIVHFEGAAQEIKPVPLGNSSKSPQGPVYAEKTKIESARTLDDVLSYNKKEEKKAA
jgi:hypothetical protein